MDGSPPGSFVHGNFQARILEWVAISFSWGTSQPRDRTHICVSALDSLDGLDGFFATEPSGKPPPLFQVIVNLEVGWYQFSLVLLQYWVGYSGSFPSPHKL